VEETVMEDESKQNALCEGKEYEEVADAIISRLVNIIQSG